MRQQHTCIACGGIFECEVFNFCPYCRTPRPERVAGRRADNLMVPEAICPICGKTPPPAMPAMAGPALVGALYDARTGDYCESLWEHQRIWRIAQPGWRRFVYHVQFARHLWRKVPGMSLYSAWTYPIDPTVGDGDPIEDAKAEISEMRP